MKDAEVFSAVMQVGNEVVEPAITSVLSELNGMAKAMGMPLDYLEKYITRIRSLEPDQIQAVSKKIIAPDQSAIVVVGDAKKIGPAVEKFK